VNTPETEGPTWTRLNEQIDWYNRKASTNQRQYKAIKLTQIVLGALVPVVAAIDDSSRVILGALGAGVVVLEAIQQFSSSTATGSPTARPARRSSASSTCSWSVVASTRTYRTRPSCWPSGSKR